MSKQTEYMQGWKDAAIHVSPPVPTSPEYTQGWNDGVKARLRAEVVTLARYGDFDGAAKPNDAAYELRSYMSNLSELNFSAGWRGGLEQMLWHDVEHGSANREDVVRLAELFVKAGGWWVWKRSAEDATFISAAEWRKKYDEEWRHLYCKCEEK